jgi:hypothetical protein
MLPTVRLLCRTVLSLAGCFAVAVLPACSSSSSGSACSLPLDNFGCPATYDAAPSQPCPPYTASASTATCGKSPIFTFVVGASGTTCFYDPASLALVGASYQDDTADLCNDTTSLAVGGQVDTSCNPTGVTNVACTEGTDGG